MPKRLTATATLLAAGAGTVATGSTAADVVTLAAPPATVKLVDCSRETRSATFHGRMKRIAGSERMWMRFALLEKRGAGFEVRQAPGLGRWRKSKPSVGVFGYRQTVRGLQPGASYRMQVNYRWYSSGGDLVAKARRRSVSCRQFERLPNLTVSVVDATRTTVEGVLRYGVRAENTGAAAATDVAVRLAVDGDVVDTVVVGLLRPATSRVLRVRGPRCRASVSAAVDPDGLLVESSEDDNVQQLACAELPAR